MGLDKKRTGTLDSLLEQGFEVMQDFDVKYFFQGKLYRENYSILGRKGVRLLYQATTDSAIMLYSIRHNKKTRYLYGQTRRRTNK